MARFEAAASVEIRSGMDEGAMADLTKTTASSYLGVVSSMVSSSNNGRNYANGRDYAIPNRVMYNQPSGMPFRTAALFNESGSIEPAYSKWLRND
ncbi:MAG: hypothetical protein LBS85_07965 [Clostridiales Family XIII bacterium]|jgi:hypothetical protein|nr:hypothetical protein [Clostridiales Family XIII bacterium]